MSIISIILCTSQKKIYKKQPAKHCCPKLVVRALYTRTHIVHMPTKNTSFFLKTYHCSAENNKKTKLFLRPVEF